MGSDVASPLEVMVIGGSLYVLCMLYTCKIVKTVDYGRKKSRSEVQQAPTRAGVINTYFILGRTTAGQQAWSSVVIGLAHSIAAAVCSSATEQLQL